MQSLQKRSRARQLEGVSAQKVPIEFKKTIKSNPSVLQTDKAAEAQREVTGMRANSAIPSTCFALKVGGYNERSGTLREIIF